MFKLRRLTSKPILQPISNNYWESKAVFNPAIVYHEGYVHMFYRACNNTFEALSMPFPSPEYKFISSIGYARSKDGIEFERMDKPIIQGEGEQESWGVEDPRISYIDGNFYMIYTAFGGRDWDDIRISVTLSKDLIHWSKHWILLDEPNKDGALHPEKVKGKYMLYHRRPPSIWVTFSDDLTNWYDHKIIMQPKENNWDCEKIGIAGPPVLVDDGWLLIYHGVDKNKVYRLGAALLDKEDPTKVIARQDEPILEPELAWEKNGLVPNVIFSCGQCIVNGVLLVYYGACDTCIGVAGVETNRIKF